MSDSDKQSVPPYVTYTSFSNWINGLRSNGLPSHITRSVLPGSNSGKATMASSLKAMGLVNEKGEPTKNLTQLTDSSIDYKTSLRQILLHTYAFLNDGSIDLKNTTTEKLVEKFVALGASGSTISKCVAFFLAAAKDTGIAVSQYVKAPTPPRSAVTKRDKKGRSTPIEEPDDEEIDAESEVESEPEEDRTVIPIPLHGMADGKITLPANLNEEDWQYAVNMAKFILENYRRKGGKPT